MTLRSAPRFISDFQFGNRVVEWEDAGSRHCAFVEAESREREAGALQGLGARPVSFAFRDLKVAARSREAGLLYLGETEKRVNRAALLELLVHGLRYVFPPQRGGLTRGLPTGASVAPLSASFSVETEPPPVWPYAEGETRGLSFSPLYKGAPQAALLDQELYKLLALCDAIRGGRTRERNLASGMLKEALTP